LPAGRQAAIGLVGAPTGTESAQASGLQGREMLKLTDNPPMSPPGAGSVAEMPGRWWVGHTKARFEKAFAWDLLHQGVGYFLPLIERVRVSGGRKRRALLPLFASYVFFCADEAGRDLAVRTNRLCRIIDVSDQPKLRSELAAIQRALSARGRLEFRTSISAGQRCRIVAGPFKDVEGVVIRRGGKTARVELAVTILGQAASMTVDADFLEAAGAEHGAAVVAATNGPLGDK